MPKFTVGYELKSCDEVQLMSKSITPTQLFWRKENTNFLKLLTISNFGGASCRKSPFAGDPE